MNREGAENVLGFQIGCDRPSLFYQSPWKFPYRTPSFFFFERSHSQGLFKKERAKRIPPEQDGIVLFIPHEGKGVQLAIKGTDLVDAAVVSGGVKCRTEKSFIRRMGDDLYLAAPMVWK